MDNGKFAERLTTSLAKRGLTQTEFAKRVGESKQTIYKYTKGITKPSKQEKIQRMALVLCVSPAWLLGIEDNEPKGVRGEIDARLDSMSDEQLEKLLQFIDNFM